MVRIGISTAAFALAVISSVGPTQAQPLYQEAIMIADHFDDGLSLPLGELVSVNFGDGTVGVSVQDPDTGAEVAVGASFPAGRLLGLDDGSVCIEFEASVAFESGLMDQATLTSSEGYHGTAVYTIGFDESVSGALADSIASYSGAGSSAEASGSVEFCPRFNRPLVMLPANSRKPGGSDPRSRGLERDSASANGPDGSLGEDQSSVALENSSRPTKPGSSAPAFSRVTS